MAAESLRQFFVIFLAVQALFTAADLFTFWNDSGRPPLGEKMRSLVFLASVWAGYFAIQFGLLALLPSAEATAAAWASLLAAHAPAAPLAPAPSVALLYAATFVIASFWDYVIHRWLLHSPWFWLLHENHHLPTRVLNGMPGISVRPFVGPATFLTYCATTATLAAGAHLSGMPRAFFSLYLEHLPPIMLLLAVIGSASHSCFLRRYLWIHRLLAAFAVTTPLDHLVHHGATARGNYGNFATLWDRLFGTYLDPLEGRHRDFRLGLPYDQDFLGTLTAGRWKLPRSWRDRYGVRAFCYLRGNESGEEAGG